MDVVEVNLIGEGGLNGDELSLSPSVTIKDLCRLQSDVAKLFGAGVKNLDSVRFNMEVYSLGDDDIDCYSGAHVIAWVEDDGNVIFCQKFVGTSSHAPGFLQSENVFLSELIKYLWDSSGNSHVFQSG